MTTGFVHADPTASSQFTSPAREVTAATEPVTAPDPLRPGSATGAALDLGYAEPWVDGPAQTKGESSPSPGLPDGWTLERVVAAIAAAKRLSRGTRRELRALHAGLDELDGAERWLVEQRLTDGGSRRKPLEATHAELRRAREQLFEARDRERHRRLGQAGIAPRAGHDDGSLFMLGVSAEDVTASDRNGFTDHLKAALEGREADPVAALADLRRGCNDDARRKSAGAEWAEHPAEHHRDSRGAPHRVRGRANPASGRAPSRAHLVHLGKRSPDDKENSMKKTQKRLSLARETVNCLHLEATQLAEVAAGAFSRGCPASRIGCPSINESACEACTWG